LLLRVCMYGLGLSLRDGRRWAWVVAVIICTFLVLLLTAILLDLVSRGRFVPDGIAYLIILILVACFSLPQLLKRETRGWFRFAERLRSEHKHHASR
jgi:hypothetical protein